jgi:hypothetical protein
MMILPFRTRKSYTYWTSKAAAVSTGGTDSDPLGDRWIKAAAETFSIGFEHFAAAFMDKLPLALLKPDRYFIPTKVNSSQDLKDFEHTFQ